MASVCPRIRSDAMDMGGLLSDALAAESIFLFHIYDTFIYLACKGM
jgi:hypothetical protein